MLLRDWLDREKLSFVQFGAAIGRTGESVRRYANGARIPDREAMVAIVQKTAGDVTANDFYRLGGLVSPGIAADFTARACPSGRRAGEEGRRPAPAPFGEAGR